MVAPKDKGSRSAVISATALAQMAVCERRVLLEHVHGRRHTQAQRSAMGRGVHAHERFHREGLMAGRAGCAHLGAPFWWLRQLLNFCMRTVLVLGRRLLRVRNCRSRLGEGE